MSVEARKVALERRHAAIEAQLHSLSSQPNQDHLQAAALKREKLRLKDELVRLTN
ncbi:MAG: DUF465 domain-containing protein [Pseudomonadota bacterium]